MNAFLVVTPLGLAQAEAFARALRDAGVAVSDRYLLASWSSAATALYARRSGDADRARRFELRWRELCPSDGAELWTLATLADHARLGRLKQQLRARFVSVPLAPAPRDGHEFSLHSFHVPDLADLAAEAASLRAFMCFGASGAAAPAARGAGPSATTVVDRLR